MRTIPLIWIPDIPGGARCLPHLPLRHQAIIALSAALTVLVGCYPTHATSLTLPSLAPMLEKVIPTVVSISVRAPATSSDAAGATLPQADGSQESSVNAVPFTRISQTVGAGVIVDAGNGYILTNNHVIEGATDIKVAVADGSAYEGSVIGSDAETDIAVVQIKASGLIAARLGDSSKLRVGDYVAAIGNPFGLGRTATFGIVSAIGRAEFGVEGYQDIIQTDASLNPGNSGGALVNLKGELVGINSAIIGASGGNVGIGFAIPINTARDIMRQLIANGEIHRGQLGVEVQNNDRDIQRAIGINTSTGALISDVISGSPAASAGMKPGDVIVAVNEVPIKSATELHARIASFPPGASVRISLARPSGRVDLYATLRPEFKGDQASISTEVEGHGILDGITLEKLSPDSDAFGKVEGALVSSVIDSSKAASAGLVPGDVIISVNQHPSPTPRLAAELSQGSDEFVLLGIFRDSHKRFLVVK